MKRLTTNHSGICFNEGVSYCDSEHKIKVNMLRGFCEVDVCRSGNYLPFKYTHRPDDLIIPLLNLIREPKK